MKKLILSGTLCLAVFAVAKFGYILDYRLSDANPTAVFVVEAKKEDHQLKKLKTDVKLKKKTKSRRWTSYKKAKVWNKKGYEKQKKKAYADYKKEKAKYYKVFKAAKSKHYKRYKKDTQKVYKMYKDKKGAVKEKYLMTTQLAQKMGF